MKILMTTDTVTGVWTYCLELIQALSTRDVQVLLAVKGCPSPDQLANARRIKNLRLEIMPFKLEWMLNPWADIAEAGDWLLSLADEYQPDVVHLNEYSHGALPWNAPVLIVGHTCMLSWMAAVRGVEPDACCTRYRQEVERGLQGASLVVAPTRHMLSAIDYFYGPFPQQQVIYNGCNPDQFEPADKLPFVFSAGRFWDEAKNLSTLAEAALELDWPVSAAGLRHPDGADGRLNAVEWLGTLRRNEMSLHYSLATIYALPAIYEPFGLTALEAALSGCVLVLGDIPSLREIWGNCACYVPPRNLSRLINTLQTLILNRELREEMSRRALIRGLRFSARRMAQNYLDCYRRLATRQSTLQPLKKYS